MAGRRARIISRPHRGHRSGERVLSRTSSPSGVAPPPTPFTPPSLPVDPLYTEQTGLNQQGLTDTLAGVTFGRTQIGQEYGYNPQGQFDPSNPYSRATLLQRTYQQSQRGTLNSMANRGQLYSGALQRGLDEGTFQYGAAEDRLKRAAAAGYQGLTEREQRAYGDFTRGNIDASSDRLGRLDPNDTVPQGPYAGPNRTQSGGPGVKPDWMTDAQWAAANRGRARQRRRLRSR
jgi:hypothetical protein